MCEYMCLSADLFTLVTCVEFEFSEYTILEPLGLLNITLLLKGKTQPTSFNVIVIANDTGSSSAIGNHSIIGKSVHEIQ